MQTLRVGLKARIEHAVAPVDTAEHFGNPGVQVLATPVLCGWFENAAQAGIRAHLESGEASVGTKLSIEHLVASPPGTLVTVEAELIEVDRRRVAFRIEARDRNELIARGTHERFVIDLARFLERAKANAVTPQ